MYTFKNNFNKLNVNLVTWCLHEDTSKQPGNNIAKNSKIKQTPATGLKLISRNQKFIHLEK